MSRTNPPESKSTARITATFKEAARSLMSICSTTYPEKVQHALELLVDSLRAGNKLLVSGTGGPAAVAMQYLWALRGRFLRDRAPLPAIAWNAIPALFTVLSNDSCCNWVFRDSGALVRSRDIVLANLHQRQFEERGGGVEDGRRPLL